ncbi:unnamed protein product [Amaranthus hypochondriacus]
MFFILIILLCLFKTSNSSFPTTINYTQWDCYNSSNYVINSSYETNLNNLVSTLITNVSSTKNGFLTHKQGLDNQNPTYGVVLCRGDLDSGQCHDCIQIATKEVTQKCKTKKQAIIWLEGCMFRYSNQSFFSLLQENPFRFMYNNESAPLIQENVQNWTNMLENSLNEVISNAALVDNTGNKYATKEAYFAPMNQTLYTLAQCTPDLTTDNCSNCLKVAVSEFYSVLKKGGLVLSPSCTIRYELYEFYKILNLTQLSPSLSPTMNSSRSSTGKNESNLARIVVAIIVPLAFGLLCMLCFYFYRRKARKFRAQEFKNVLGDLATAESLMFDLGTLEAATKNFSLNNKLGEGGFGSVYKGTLQNGQEIAVKRLSKVSGQGVEEFKNEVVLIANLQHRNLVRLLGFCLAGKEKLLVYEFVPNKSLNYFLFGERKLGEINWNMRYNIIKGIARGLLYLHEDSRPRIIHRDLKTANILLDADMNPKISDFGLARIFKVEQTVDDTSRVVGTYGYMAPEYAMHGQFSTKSDIYSFGVLVLEIVCGKKISSKSNLFGDGDLLTYAWTSLIEEKPLEFIDPTLLKDSPSSEEVLRCIQIGLLCTQESTNERPTMSTIVLILNNDSTTTSTLSTPQRPRSFCNAASSVESSLVSNPRSAYSAASTTSNDSILNSGNQGIDVLKVDRS